MSGMDTHILDWRAFCSVWFIQKFSKNFRFLVYVSDSVCYTITNTEKQRVSRRVPREDKMNVKDKYTDTKELVQECMDLASDWDINCDEEFILNVLIKAATKSGWDYEINKLYFNLCSSYDVSCEMLD